MLGLCNFLKMLMVSDKTIHKDDKTHINNSINKTHLKKNNHFHCLPKLYFGFKATR